ncbi:MAG: ankyrin repeat domain-containing protein [Alphaproteobacteria bacterium]|nr:ankyrin repeat domain-containing protein [Alphaproteobacteria bacterium]
MNDKASKELLNVLALNCHASKDELLAQCKDLIAAGADVNIADKAGWCPLLNAAYLREVAVMAALLDGGANINITNRAVGSALHVAAMLDDVAMAEFLLARGACPDVRSAKGITPLMQAVWMGNEDMISVLLREGADMHIHDLSDNSAVRFARPAQRGAISAWFREEEDRRLARPFKEAAARGTRRTPQDFTPCVKVA